MTQSLHVIFLLASSLIKKDLSFIFSWYRLEKSTILGLEINSSILICLPFRFFSTKEFWLYNETMAARKSTQAPDMSYPTARLVCQ